MGRICLPLLVLCTLMAPGVAWAQASLAGVVRDPSGGVLPGVTVEASSPALIEKARTVVTDSGGQYRIVDLRPGEYTITFTLAGFSTVRREGITLQGTMTATIDTELRVGGARGNDYRHGCDTPCRRPERPAAAGAQPRDYRDAADRPHHHERCGADSRHAAVDDLQRGRPGRRRQHR